MNYKDEIIKDCEQYDKRINKKKADELFQKKNLKSFEVAHIIARNKRRGNYEDR